MNETKKVSKKQKTTKGNMRRNILMIILCIALLSSATYAWFTLSNSAKISNLSLTVGGAGGLLISYKSDGDFGSELKLGDASDKKVIPASIGAFGGKTALFRPDTYTTAITNMVEVTDAEKLKYNFTGSASGSWNAPTTAYCVEQDFWLKVNSEGNYNISLNAANFDGFNASDASGLTGSYIIEKNSSGNYVLPTASDLNAADILRIAFYTFDATGTTATLAAVYEPNADAAPTVNAGEYIASPATFTPYSANVVQQGINGKFGSGSTYNDSTSGTLFRIAGGTQPTKIRMQVYFDGDDAQCANGVALEKIFGQIEFVSEAATP